MRVQKWGNSAARRLPTQTLKQLGLKIGDEVQTEIQNNALIIRKPARYTLQGLIDEMNGDLQRAEHWDTMPECGKETVA